MPSSRARCDGWKYTPLLKDGKAMPACRSVTFAYIPDDAEAGDGR